MYIYKGDRRRASGSDFWVQEAELSDGEIGGRGLDRFEEQKVLRASATIRSSETRRKIIGGGGLERDLPGSGGL